MSSSHLQIIRAHLATLPVAESLSQALIQMVERDVLRLSDVPHWSMTISRVGRALHVDPEAITCFEAAWGLLYITMRRLDHVQDNDSIDDDAFSQLSVPMRYHLMLCAYLLSASILEQLEDRPVGTERRRRLRHLWHESLFRAASGQHQDLALQTQTTQPTMEQYQTLVHGKAGPLYRLAFGGLATLASDDQVIISVLTDVGELYGALVQYADDLVDAAVSSSQDSHLAAILVSERPDLGLYGTIAASRFFEEIARAYQAHAAALLEHVEHALAQEILTFFEETFACSPIARHQ